MKAKNCLAGLLCLALFVSVATERTYAAEERGVFAGQGTADAPYCIENAGQMWALARLVNGGDAHYAEACYRLTANIDLGTADWVPIGRTADTPFRGSFDGDGYAVTGLRADDFRRWRSTERPKLEYTDPETMTTRLPDEVLDRFPVGGFFGVTQGAVIDDLCVEGTVYSLRILGGLVGWAKDTQIRNCVVRAHWLDGSHLEAQGSIVGKSEGSLIENSCYVPKYGCVTLVGRWDNATRIINSFSAGRQNINNVMENRSSHYYRGDGSYLAVWERVELPEQRPLAVPIAELAAELNAWVDGQEPGKYRHWRTPEGQDGLAWPVMADHLVTVRETPPVDEEERFWFQTRELKGDRVAGTGDVRVYTAMDGRPPRLTGLVEENGGFQAETLQVDGQEVMPDRLPIVTQDVILDVSYKASGSMDNFTMTAPAISYPDVPADAWYGADHENVVEDVTRLGFFVGRDDGRFAPEESLLLCETVKLAATVHSIYTADGYVFDQKAGEHWYDTYTAYAVEHGLMVDWEFDDLERPATRMEVAYLLGGALPRWELDKTSVEQHFTPPDVENESSRYYWTVFYLYLGGVLQGMDETGNFYPQRVITRAEVAAILTRLTLPERRL